VEKYIGLKRNGDKTQMQNTHHNALDFMGIVITCLIMQYKPYIVEQSCTGLSIGGGSMGATGAFAPKLLQ